MTDNEIIKALEICVDKENRCGECPYCQYQFDLVTPCAEKNGKDLLDLISRQKADIERLKALSKHHQTLINMLNEGIATARTEAIKEFAERLKANSSSFQMYGEPAHYIVTIDGIDYLVKEMVGEG